MYNKNKTSYNLNIKHAIKISTFARFQQPYPLTISKCNEILDLLRSQWKTSLKTVLSHSRSSYLDIFCEKCILK